MKMFKIIGLLCAAIFASNIQSMQNEFAVEEQFLQGQLSANGYLSYIASLSPDFAYKIRAIRNSHVNDPQDSYEQFLIELNEEAQLAQRALAHGNVNIYTRMVRNIQIQVMDEINRFYKELKENLGKRYGREH